MVYTAWVSVIHRVLSYSFHRGGSADEEVCSRPKFTVALACASRFLCVTVDSIASTGLPGQRCTQGSGSYTGALRRPQMQLEGECKGIGGRSINIFFRLFVVKCRLVYTSCGYTPQAHCMSCLYRPQPCPYCRDIYPARWLGEHVNHCSFRRVKCQFCSYETAINLMDVSLVLCMCPFFKDKLSGIIACAGLTYDDGTK